MTAAPIILFGGTFDPPHRHHPEMARRAMQALGAEQVIVMPARLNPQRAAAPPASAKDRLDMARLAFAEVPGATVSDMETRREGASFTVDTLRELRARGERRPIRLLLGSDQAINFGTWREPESILGMATPAVVLRPPHTRDSFARDIGGDRRWLSWLLPIEPIDNRSTEIRRRLAAGESIADLVHPGVEKLIRERGLYRAPRS